MTKMVHYGVPKWCIMMYQNGALWYTKIVHLTMTGFGLHF